MEREFRLKGKRVFAACAIGLACLMALFGRRLFSSEQVFDFTGFWIGAKLLGSSKLYDVTANLALQQATVGKISPAIIFVRPPFWALAIKPFTLLPYGEAIVLWKALLIVCLIAFVACLPTVPHRYTALAICWSLPAARAIFIANDSPLILLLLGLSLLFWKQGRSFLSGVMQGLCLAKFHFLIFLPLLLCQRRYRKVLAGFLLVLGCTLAINFAVQPNWLQLYWRALHLPQENMNAHPTLMPNLYASFFWTGHPGFAIAAGALFVGSILLVVCRRAPFGLAMPLCILGGLLVAPHTNELDAILAIPAMLAVARAFPQFRWAVYLLLSPFAALLYGVGPSTWGPAVFVAGTLCLMYAVSRRIGSDIASPGGLLDH